MGSMYLKVSAWNDKEGELYSLGRLLLKEEFNCVVH